MAIQQLPLIGRREIAVMRDADVMIVRHQIE
jgi:hypothetical protein